MRKVRSYASPARHMGRIKALRALGFLAFVFVALRLVSIQALWGEELQALAKKNAVKVNEIVASRGFVVDRHDNLLAVEFSRTRDLRVDAVGLQDEDYAKARKILAHHLGLFTSELDTLLAHGDRNLLLRSNMEEALARQIEDAALPFVYLRRRAIRFYPQDALAGNVLGGLNSRHKPVGGLEAAWDSVLAGENGKAYYICAKNNEPYRPAHGPRKEAKPGKNLSLFLDLKLQSAAHEELADCIERYQALAGQVVVLDPKRGEVLAMVSLPSLDPNEMSQWKAENARVRSVSDIYEPGSTFKLLTFAAALESGHLTDFDEPVYCHEGNFRVHGIPIHDSNRKGYDTLTVAEIFTNSSNIGTAVLAQRMSKEELYVMARSFGLGQMLGIDLPGEVSGRLLPLSKWGPVEFVNIAMGQGVAVTPLQMACAFGAVVNDGVLVRPRLVDRVLSAQDSRSTEVLPIRRVIQSSTASRLRDLLVQTVEDGTGQAARIDGIRVGGKTGTAQKVKPEGGYSQKDYMSSFVGFAEIGQRQLVCLVVIDTPRGQFYGGTVAAPVFKKVMERALHLDHEQQIAPGPLYLTQAEPKKAQSDLALENTSVLPDLKQMSLAKALHLLSALGQIPTLQGEGGTILDQEPRAGSALSDVDGVILHLGEAS
jgi:cell division protein FtsI/penicillin-binding protein 2